MRASLDERLPTAASPQSRDAAIDGLRGLAVLAVYAVHANVPGFGGGFYGVDVFFVVSGFLISSLLVREHAANGGIGLRSFWARRFFRLAPELALVIACGGLVAADLMFYSHSARDYWVLAASAVTLSTNWLYVVVDGDTQYLGALGPLWSLAIEEQFYLCVPPLLAWLLARGAALGRLAAGFVVVAVASALVRVALYEPVQYPTSYFNTFARLDGLLVGVALGLLLKSARSGAALLARVRPWHGWAAIATIAALVTAGRHNWFAHHAGFASVGLLTAVLLLALQAAPRGTLARLLSWRPLAFTGRISYAFYLVHLAAIYLVADRLADQRWLVRTAVSFGTTFAFASLSYVLVYRPVTAWRRRRFAS